MKKIIFFFLFMLFSSLFSSDVFSACQTGYFPTSEANTTRKFIVCDTQAELPSSGWSQGDLTYAKDTKIMKIADSTTTVSPPYFEGGWLQLQSGTSPVSTECDSSEEAGKMFFDSDATTGQRIYACEGVSGWVLQGDGGGGGGEANTASNLGGGLANFDTKSAIDLRFNSFSSTDFDLASNLLTIDTALTRDTEWDTEGEVQTAWGSVNILLETEIDASSELSTLVDDETGTGALVFADSPTLVTPALGTPASGVATNLTGTASGLTAGALSYTVTATLANDQATAADTNPVSLTGLVFTYAANSTYRIWFMGRVSPAAASTGCGFQFDLSSAVTDINLEFYHQLASTGTLSGGHSIADDSSVGVSSGMPANGGTYPVFGQGILRTTGNTGTAQLRFRSETTAVTTAKAGLTLVVEKIA